MKNSVAFGLVLLSVVLAVSADRRCHNYICPRETTGCKLHLKSSYDKRYLDRTVSCLDEDNMVLKDYITQEVSPYGQFTNYESTSYSNTHTGPSVVYPGNDRYKYITNNNIHRGNYDDEVEEFV